MSNFTDFFPTGLPVNTYESFYVSATGNPTGYDATTGLYTHPNGDYWLKTGKILVNQTATYPNASTTDSGWVDTGVTFAYPSSTTNRAIYRTTQNQFYEFRSATAGTVPIVINSATAPFGQVSTTNITHPSVGAPNENNHSFADWGYDEVNDRIWACGGGRNNGNAPSGYGWIGAWSGTAPHALAFYRRTGGSYSGYGSNGALFVDTGAGRVYTQGSNQSPSEYYDLVTFANTTFAWPGPFGGASFNDSLNILGRSNDFNRYQYTSPYTQTYTSGATPGGGTIGIYTTDTNTIIYKASGNTTYVEAQRQIEVGDATARTDTDSGQPLFIKLK